MNIKITFANNDSIVLNEKSIIHCVVSDTNNENGIDGSELFTGTFEHERLPFDKVRAISSVLGQSDWFRITNSDEPNKLFKCSSIVYIDETTEPTKWLY